MSVPGASSSPDSIQAPRSLRLGVRNHLRNLILDGTLQPGDRIVESRLARELGISQAPIREALRELEQMGLVVSFPNRGSSVRQILPRDAEEMYTLRAHLEVLAISLALPRMTPADFNELDSLIDRMLDAARANDPERLTEWDTRFHEFICEKANHSLLLRTWQDINPLNWTMITVIRTRDRNLEELAERHRPIVTALKAGNSELAQAEVREHVLVLGNRVVRELRVQEVPGKEPQEQ